MNSPNFKVRLAVSAVLGLVVPRVGLSGPLPVPCVGGSCGPTAPSTWVTSGLATATQTANSLVINQTSDRAILNWKSFDVGADSSVQFKQPGTDSLALNRIYQGSPSKILGTVQANGQIYLINQNGFLFGNSARVNTGGLVASSLNITTDTFNNGILTALSRGAPAFAADPPDPANTAGGPSKIEVQQGAEIKTNAAGQRILLAAPNVENSGTLSAPDGQVILAGGDKVYVQASTDASLRGLFVEVGGEGSVTNKITGSITADRGNVTLVGLAVNQQGRASATTSVSVNGSVRLLARGGSVSVSDLTTKPKMVASENGELQLGAQSVTSVIPDVSDDTAVDEQTPPVSTLEFVGRDITFAGGSQVKAPGGSLQVTAASIPTSDGSPPASDPASHIRIESGASIDLSGSVATASVTRNLVAVELRANELADSPQQRNGALRGQTVIIDARVGTPLANVKNAIALTQRDVLERTANGGNAVFDSAGDVVFDSGASINVSGGHVDYTPGFMRTTQLLLADGSTVDIGQASPDRTYSGLINPSYRLVSDRWGVIENITAPGLANFDPGYVEGKSAGTVQFLGNAMLLNGTFTGTAVNGAYQRTPDTRALGGQLIVGQPGAISDANFQNLRAPSVQVVSEAPPVIVAPGAPVPPGLPLFLTTSFITHGGFSRLQIASANSVSIETPIDLPEGGTVNLIAPQVNVDADITAPGGSISATAFVGLSGAPTPRIKPFGLFVGDGVSLDVRGLWTNDTTVPLDQRPTDSVFVDGGSIQLIDRVGTDGTLEFGTDVKLLADGGAWLQRSGTVTGGRGGSVSIGSTDAAGGAQTTIFGENLMAEAFGVQGAAGGSFKLQVPRLSIGVADEWLAAQTVSGNVGEKLPETPPDESPEEPPAEGSEPRDGGVLNVGTSLFTDHGFSSFTLIADGAPLANDDTPSVLTVKSDAQIDFSAQTRVLNSNFSTVGSGARLEDFSTTQLLPDFRRTAGSLSLLAVPTGSPASDALGSLIVEKGASFVGNAGSSMKFSSMGDLTFDGSIRIASGTVQLTNVKPDDFRDKGYVADRQLVVGRDAVIDVSGTTVYQPNDMGRLLGSVLNGGSVSLIAARGSIVTEAGSSIDFSGTQAALDLQIPGVVASFARHTVSSAAGSLFIQAPESITMQGNFVGAAGVGDGGANLGGSLTVALARSGRTGDPTLDFGVDRSLLPTFPTAQRVLQLIDGLQSGAGEGFAFIDTSRVAASGVDSATFISDDRISIGAGVSLALARSLTLDTRALEVLGGGSANLSAAYVALGSQVAATSAPLAPSFGTGKLAVQADQIDFIGALALQQIGQATFGSTGDITLRGYPQITNGPTGSLTAAGDVTLRAARISPSTASSYTITATGADSTVRFEQAGTSPGVPLSAAGSLTVNAANIVQAGTLIAPFGSIALNATDSLVLANGSYTSVSGNGALIPYGRVDNDTSWLYGLSALATTPVTAIPERHVTLNGATVDINNGATIDIAGGGDLYAYQFTPGTGGTADALASGATPGLYAIVPSLVGSYGPYDPFLWNQSGLKVGDSVYLAGGAGLPAGVYPLLPARYALLPGAYLVSAASGFQDLQPGSVATAADGASVLAGYRDFGTQAIGGARYSGFVVHPGSYAHELAQYDDRLASKFFVDTPDATTHNVLPRDSGTLTIAIQESLKALGSVRAAAAQGGINGTIEIAAPAVEIGGTGVTENAAQLSSSVLQAWSPGRLLLGGMRDSTGAISPVASSVIIHGDASLSADEILLVARDSIELESGASLSTKSANNSTALDASRFAEPQQLTLTGDHSANSAVVAISDLAQWLPERSQSTDPAGAIDISAGSTLATRGAVTLDSPGRVEIADGTISARDAYWALGASNILIGAAAPQEHGLVIDGSVLAALEQASSVRLTSAGSIGLLQAADLSLASRAGGSSITLTATSIDNLLPGANSTFSADRLVLNGSSASAPALSQGTGSIDFSGKQVELGDGVLGLSGFGSTSLTSAGTLLGTGTGGLATAGDLSVSASAITAKSGARMELTAAGAVNLAASSSNPTLADLESGGTVEIRGASIVDRARIEAPSGLVTLAATGALSLEAGSRINVAGISPSGAARGSNGGSISLSAGGALTFSPSGLLDVSAGAHADAGSIDIFAGGGATLSGAISASADAGARGGSFRLDAQSLNGFQALNNTLEQGGFTNARGFHLGSGDLTLTSSDTITASQIELITDAGAINIDGKLLAASGTQRGSIVVNARDDVSVGAGAVLGVSAADEADRGGTIELATTQGTLRLNGGASLRATGADGSGRLVLRAPATADDFNLSGLPTSLRDVDSVVLQPSLAFTLNDPSLDFDTVHAALDAYMANAPSTILARLSPNGAGSMTVQVAADMTHDGDLVLPAYDFSSWRFGGQPAALSVRASGKLEVSGVLTDGFFDSFSALGDPALDLLGDNSSSITLVAGADLNSASLTGTRNGSAADLVLDDGAIVRTGTGDLTLMAARDVVFGAGASVYTGGKYTPGFESVNNEAGVATSPDGGGSVRIGAGRDILGSVVTQPVADWQSRRLVFGPNDNGQVYWGIDFTAFNWNVGALGGGDVNLSSGRDTVDLSAAVADSNAPDLEGDRVQLGGGNLNVATGRDFASGLLYVGYGTGTVHADGALSSSGHRNASGITTPLGTMLMSGDANYDVSAIGGVILEGDVLASALFPTRFLDDGLFFARYGADSSLRVASAGGNLDFHSNRSRAVAFIGNSAGMSSATAFQLYPAKVEMGSYGGDLLLNDAFVTLPSANNGISLYAARDIRDSGVLSTADGLPSLVPTAAAPSGADDLDAVLFSKPLSLVLHQNDPTSNLVVAGRDIVNLDLRSSKAATIQAGRDILDLNFQGQNASAAADITSITAGRDILFSAAATSKGISVGGHGQLEVLAGRDIDLGFSTGIVTAGNLTNANLPKDGGADVIVMAGLAAPLGLPQAATGAKDFINDIVGATTDARDALVDFVEKQTDAAGLDFAAAATAFRSMGLAQQLPFAAEALFGELVASGREANDDPTKGFTRGFAAIESLFPGSKPDSAADAPNAFSGNLSLPFSRIYTLAGGSVSLLVPGGSINVGLANPPPDLARGGLVRFPSDLGIVAQRQGDVHILSQGDVLVNESRIFTLGGGSIAIWSSKGNIDAGRGSKSAISAPPPTILVNPSTGAVTIDFSSAVAGSGIRTILTSDVKPGDVDLIAPVGFVNAGDAGIGAAGNLNVAAQSVIGLDNIQVGGTSTGVPPETSGLGVSLSSASSTASAASNSSTSSMSGPQKADSAAPLAQSALSWLDVFVEGFGEDTCKASDLDCLKRQKVN